MGVQLHDSILDAALTELEKADQEVVCEGEPVSYAEATTDKGAGGKALGEVAIDAADFTKADGDTSGRKSTVAQQSGVSVDVSGDADHVALVDDGASTLLLVTTAPTQAVTAGNTMTINAFKLELLDAVAA